VPAEDVTDASVSQLIDAAVDGWVADSRGQAEARVFRFGAVVTPAMLAGAPLAALPLQALAGAAAPGTGPACRAMAAWPALTVRLPPPAQPGTSSSASDPADTAKSPGTSASRPCGLMAALSRS
jgi:Family of unknown function (DUF6183)